VVHYCLIGAVWNTRVSSSGGVVMTGVATITVLHAIGRGELELSPLLETKSSSLDNSSRMACNDGDPLRVMPLNIAPESAPLLVSNSRFLEWTTDVLGELVD
jgi:hypothetical protein